MTDPNPRPNRIIPNAYQSPNFYIDDLLPLLSGEEWKCMSFLIRKTLGWQKYSDRLAKSVIAKATGLAEATVDRSMASLIEFGLALRVNPNNINHDGIEYSVQMYDEKINWDALEGRKQKNAERNKNRTLSANKALKIKIAAAPSVPHTQYVAHTPSQYVAHTPSQYVAHCTQKPIKDKNERYAEIASALSNISGGALNTSTAALIGEWIEKHADEWILKAVGIASDKGARSAKYVDEILIGWEANGYPKPRAERVVSAKRQPVNVYDVLGVSPNA
jgi:phage replication O-like protein O